VRLAQGSSIVALGQVYGLAFSVQAVKLRLPMKMSLSLIFRAVGSLTHSLTHSLTLTVCVCVCVCVCVQWDYVSQLMNRCRELQELQDASSNAEHPSPPPITSLDIDTNICADSFTAAAVAAGAACRAVDRVATSQIAPRRAFVAVRPPGHHAGPRGRVLGPDGEAVSSSQGFCLLNSVAIAAAYARYNYRGLLRRIAMVDFDVHYGDGTAACVLNLVPGTHHVSAGHGVHISMPSYKPWLDQTDPSEVPPAAIISTIIESLYSCIIL